MKVPLFIFCVAVTYGVCSIYAQEDVDLTEGAINDENYSSSYPIIPSERFLLRHRRASLLSDLLSPVKTGLNIVGKVAGSPITNVMDNLRSICDILTGKKECPKVEKLSIDLIKNALVEPIETLKTVVCYFVTMLGSEGRHILGELCNLLWKFVMRTFLPWLHTVLNYLKDKNYLPASIIPLVEMFNVFYALLKLLGYVG